MPRNVAIEDTVSLLVETIDGFIAGDKLLVLPSARSRSVADQQLAHRASSVRLASLFLAFYSTMAEAWDCDSIPVGIRGQYGDKKVGDPDFRNERGCQVTRLLSPLQILINHTIIMVNKRRERTEIWTMIELELN